MKELSANELKQFNGGGPGEDYVLIYLSHRAIAMAIVLAKPGVEAISSWW